MNPDRPPSPELFSLSIDLSHPNLLAGFDHWLALGLLDDEQVKYVARWYLSCQIPTPEPAIDYPVIENTFPREEEALIPRSVSRQEKVRRLVTNAWESFREELSVRWLLFLGIFLVVLSSAVLAGTQWQNISRSTQYIILWSYTVIFWSIGFFLKRQANLQLTSQTLQIISLFLIPVNFWAIDTFGLWSSGTGLVVTVIATVSLLGILYFQSRSSLPILYTFGFLGLSLLQWGWGIDRFSIVAIYSGVILTGILLVFIVPRQEISRSVLGKSLLLYGGTILLIRGGFIDGLPREDLGLVIGIWGWIFPYYTSGETSAFIRSILEAIAVLFLSLGWGFTVLADFPLSATIISLFALHFFWKRLSRAWWTGDVISLFLVGLQLWFRIENLIPATIRESFVNNWVRITGDSIYSNTFYGITYFPYLVLWVLFSRWLYRRERLNLARIAEYLALVLGIFLTLNSISNPVARSINLSLSTATLLYTLFPQPIRVRLLYFTHSIALFTIASIVDTVFPNLDASGWSIVFLTLMAIEWIASMSRIPAVLAKSNWYFGFILASIAYLFLLPANASITPNPRSIAWLLTPIMLTVVAVKSPENRRREAAVFSSIALLIAQTLTLWQPETRIIGLGISVVLMLGNSFYLHQRFATRLHIGFILATIFVTLWQYGFQSETFAGLLLSPNWILANAEILSGLWLTGLAVRARRDSLFPLYADSIHEWGIFLCLGNLGILTLHLTLVVIGLFTPNRQVIASGFLLGTSLLFYSRNRLDNFAVWVVMWLGEIIAAESVLWTRRDFLLVSGINLLLGFAVLAITRPLLPRFPSVPAVKFAPLLFAGMAIFWRWGDWNAYTGLIILGASAIGFGVSLSLQNGQILGYLSLIGITAAIYECILYQASLQTGGNVSDLYLILSRVTVAIAFGYRLLVRWCRQKGRESLFSLSLPGLTAIAHGHWFVAVLWKFVGIPEYHPNPLFFAFSLVIAAYPILQGRNRPQGWWVYLGVADLYSTAIVARLFGPELEGFDPFFGAISCIFAFAFYEAPWERWGWRSDIWRNIAIGIPLLTAFLTFIPISYFSILLIAVFYAWIALRPGKIRWSYLSVAFANWGIFRFFIREDLTDVLFYAVLTGLSLLYIAQVDPFLRSRRVAKHYWRVAGSGLICVTAVLFHQETGGWIPAAIALATIVIGLGTRIRAFLFVGTSAFLLTVAYQLIVLGFEYSVLKWLIGLIVGILIISIAAIFERLKEQVIALWQNVLEQLRQWE
ncbi:hypothetical protein V0288_17870 [Pannus brasiliensis CCIBt3594]|uniref:DUF2157 domain-containing protein n=1 Tax=Pannus brasiliensis CCIBt3594 TaxID=1427578 RepID=A0AAW9QZ12_9CHRO